MTGVLAGAAAMARTIVAAAVTPSPTPSPAIQVDPNLGSPGILGFVFTFALALVLIGLALSLTRHLRKVDRNARLAAAAETPPSAGQDGPAGAAGTGAGE